MDHHELFVYPKGCDNYLKLSLCSVLTARAINGAHSSPPRICLNVVQCEHICVETVERENRRNKCHWDCLKVLLSSTSFPCLLVSFMGEVHHCTDKYALKLDVHCFPGLYMNLCESNLAYMGCKVCVL